ncbi:hypothetical protein MTO96_047444 [Rhipicephalus appendiculatus]
MSADKKENIRAWLQAVRRPPWISVSETPPVPPVPPVPPPVPPLLRPFPAFNANDENRGQLLPPPNAAPGYQLPDRHGDRILPDATAVEGEPTKPANPPTPAKWPLRPVLKSAQAYKKQAADADKRTQQQQQQQPAKAPKVGVVPKAYAAREDTVVRFLLLKARDLDPVDDRESCSPYVVFKLGNEKYVSKVIEDTNDPVWNEPFDIFVPVGNSLLLQVMIMDKDPAATSDFIGRLDHYFYKLDLIYENSRELPAAFVNIEYS